MTPERRTLVARIAAHSRWAGEDPTAGTEAARAKGPGRIDFWLARVDPEGVLSEAERLRRAESAKRAHFSRLALASAKSRGRQRPGSTSPSSDLGGDAA